jgi:hypothetical protein
MRNITVFRIVIAVLVVVAVVLLLKVYRRPEPPPPTPLAPNAFQLSSTAFENGQPVPVRHTCDGPDLSPPLAWKNPPARTVTFALVLDDTDAPMGSYTHWLICDMPLSASSLPEGVPAVDTLPGPVSATQGTNDARKTGYFGPCPPSGSKAHRYFFRLYALDSTLDMPGGFSKYQLRAAMGGHVLAHAELMGTYQRQ